MNVTWRVMECTVGLMGTLLHWQYQPVSSENRSFDSKNARVRSTAFSWDGAFLETRQAALPFGFLFLEAAVNMAEAMTGKWLFSPQVDGLWLKVTLLLVLKLTLLSVSGGAGG